IRSLEEQIKIKMHELQNKNGDLKKYFQKNINLLNNENLQTTITELKENHDGKVDDNLQQILNELYTLKEGVVELKRDGEKLKEDYDVEFLQEKIKNNSLKLQSNLVELKKKHELFNMLIEEGKVLNEGDVIKINED